MVFALLRPLLVPPLKRWPAFFASRAYASAVIPQNDPSKIRNIALVAHIDSGKTTLTESILLTSDYLSASGTVDTGSTTTDFLPAERERGITIQSASIPVHWKNWTFNLIDTPGHADFGMEVESASRVVDGAVVLVDSVEGVEAQTKGVWRQLDRYGVRTRMIFLNKLDRPGASFKSSLLSLLSNRLHPTPMVLTLPIASFESLAYETAEPGIQGLVDLVNWEVWKWDEEGNSTRHPLPRKIEQLRELPFLPASHPVIPLLVSARSELLENISMKSEQFMESLIDLPTGPDAYLGVKAADIMPHLRDLTMRNEILPVVCGSAMKNIGTALVMDFVGELFPSPLDVHKDLQHRNAPVRALAWKVGWDKRKGWMTFVRVYSGNLKRHSMLMNINQNEKERATKLLLLYASDTREVEELPFGSVGVILGLKYTRTGDTLMAVGAPESVKSSLPAIIPPASVIAASVIPQSHSDLIPVQEALTALARTDPSVRVDMQEGQLLIHGLGALHLEILEGRLKDEWDVQFELGTRRVSYREGLGPGKPSEGSNLWQITSGNQQMSISLSLSLRPLEDNEEGDPIWDGNTVVDKNGKPLPSPDVATKSAEAYIARGLSSTLSNSVHSSLAISRVHITVEDFDYSAATVAHLTAASAVILRNLIRDAGMGPIMEPYVTVKVSVNEDSLGKAVKDITEHGGEVLELDAGSTIGPDGSEEVGGFTDDFVYIPPAILSPSGGGSSHSSSSPKLKRTVYAVAPLSRMLDYNNRLRALSGGHGLFEMANAGFRKVSDTRKLEILRELGRA